MLKWTLAACIVAAAPAFAANMSCETILHRMAEADTFRELTKEELIAQIQRCLLLREISPSDLRIATELLKARYPED